MMPFIKKIVPKPIISILKAIKKKYYFKYRIFFNYKYDRLRFETYGCPTRQFKNKEHLLSYIIMLYHSIEKGLSLPKPRPGFGKEKIKLLIININIYIDTYGSNSQIISALFAIENYLLFNQQNESLISEIKKEILPLKKKVFLDDNELSFGGTIELRREEIWKSSKIDLSNFFNHRFSIRNFAADPVSKSDLLTAIKLAQKTPSVCNRQSARVYIFDNDDRGKAILACQNGNKGFGDTANKILIITSELGSFLSIGERNQCWIDGGLFAMSLIYALHSLGIGTCCLNWSMEHESDKRLRKIADVKSSENIIMLIAVGHLPESFKVAYSHRYDEKEITRDFSR